MGWVAREKYLLQQQGKQQQSDLWERERERPMVAGLRWLRGVQILIPALADLWLQGCGGCEEYRDLYLHWETTGCRVAVVARSADTYTCTGRPLVAWVAVVARSTETCTRTGRPMVAGLLWLWRVQRRIPALTGGPSSLCEFKTAVNIKDLYGNSGKRFKSINTR